MKGELDWKMMKEFIRLRAKTYSYLIDDDNQGGKTKGTKKCAIKRKHKVEEYKTVLEATQLANKINQLEKVNADSLRENHKEFLRSNTLILKLQQRIRSEQHNLFTEEISKIAESGNDDKRVQSINSIETYENGTSKDLVCRKKKLIVTI